MGENKQQRTRAVATSVFVAVLLWAPADIASAEAKGDAGQPLCLENDFTRLCLDPERFSLLDLVDKRTGTSYVVEPGGSLFEIAFLDQPTQFYRTTRACAITGAAAREPRWELDGNRLHLHFGQCPVGTAGHSANVTVTVELPPDDSMLVWSLRLETDAPFPLHEIRFPTLQGLGSSVEGSEKTDYLVVPSKSGTKLSSPRSEASCGQGWTDYPAGGGAIQMLSYCDGMGKGSLYLAAEDARGYRKTFCSSPLASKRSFGWHVLHYADGTMAEGKWSLPYRVACGPTQGDWYDACKRYRKWALSQEKWRSLHQRTDIPQWFLDLSIWYQGQDRNPSEERMAKHVERLRKIRERLGEPFGFHWYLWQKGKNHDHGYPDYFPAQPGFADAVARVQEFGVKVMPYINVELFDTVTGMWKDEEVEPWASRDERGNLYKVLGWTDARQMVNMCPATKYWQDKMVDCVKRLVGEYGVDAVYLDELHVYPYLCHATNHGHARHGGTHFTDGYRTILQRAKAECGKRDLVLTGEQCTETYTDLVDGQLNVYDLRPDTLPVFQSALKDCTVEMGLFVSRVDLSLNRFAAKLGFTFVRGRQLGWINLDQTDLLDPGYDSQVEFLRKLARCRRACQDFLLYGEFLRPPDLSSAPTHEVWWMMGMTGKPELVVLPNVLASAYRAPNGDVGLVLANITSAPQEATIPINEKNWGLRPGARHEQRLYEDGQWQAPGEVVLGAALAVEVSPLSPTVVRLRRMGA